MDGFKWDARFVVMLVVSTAWLAYVSTELWRNRPPEIWTWGILSGVWAALYQPWQGRGSAPGDKTRHNDLPGAPTPPGLGADAEDET